MDAARTLEPAPPRQPEVPRHSCWRETGRTCGEAAAGGAGARVGAVGVVLRALLDEQLRDENYDRAPEDDGQHGPGTHKSYSDPIHLFPNAEVQPKLGRASAARIRPVSQGRTDGDLQCFGRRLLRVFGADVHPAPAWAARQRRRVARPHSAHQTRREERSRSHAGRAEPG